MANTFSSTCQKKPLFHCYMVKIDRLKPDKLTNINSYI